MEVLWGALPVAAAVYMDEYAIYEGSKLEGIGVHEICNI